MSLLQQPVLFASEPSSGLVGLGVVITVTAILVVVTLLVAFAASSREKTPTSTGREDCPTPNHSSTGCSEVALKRDGTGLGSSSELKPSATFERSIGRH